MKILRVITSMNPTQGGPSQGIRNSIPEMKKIGIDNEVVCFDADNKSFPESDNFTIHTIGPSKGPYSYCKSLTTWLRNNFSRFDVVIIHGLWLYNSYGTLRSWKSYRRNNPSNYPKLCVMPHGMLDPYFQKDKSRRLKAIRNWTFWKLFESRVVNQTDGVLFTSGLELELAKSSFIPYHPKEAINVSYGVAAAPDYTEDMQVSLKQQSRISIPAVPYLLFLSRIHPKKGVDLLITAYNNLIKVCTLPPLVIAGPGLDTSYGESLLKLASDNPRITFSGMLKGEAKYAAFYGCEAFVLPSHQENFGIAVAEALSCKKPVLITKEVNIWPEIVESSAGFAEEDTLTGITRLLKKWSQVSSDQKKAYSQNAYKCYTNNFSVNSSSLRLAEVLEKL